MALLRVLKAPNPQLALKAHPVAHVDADIRTFMDDLLETMYAETGIGLAATQVGVQKRVIVVDTSSKENPSDPYYMANPEIIEFSEETNIYPEGCLSVPGGIADITRPSSIKLTYLNYHNQRQELTADGLLARCLQHEIDHLDGILFIDHLSSLKKDIILRKSIKAQRVTL